MTTVAGPSGELCAAAAWTSAQNATTVSVMSEATRLVRTVRLMFMEVLPLLFDVTGCVAGLERFTGGPATRLTIVQNCCSFFHCVILILCR